MALGSSNGFLSRLAGDTRGNTLAIMTAAMLPLAGMVGGGLDMSRLYLVKSRLQQACDAGALAGRKRMGAGAWSQASNAPNTVAGNFFDSNFGTASYGTTGRTRSFSEANGKVTGTARVDVPMTLMRIFGFASKEISVTCNAEQRLPNTDVMFVLDVTGSMAADPAGNYGGGESRMTTLKYAAKCFYEALAKLDIDDVTCPGASFGGVSSGTQVRFGFVPYDSGVNVARLITSDESDVAPPSLLTRKWDYQTRLADYSTPVPGTTFTNLPDATEQWTDSRVGNLLSKNDCGTWGRNTTTDYEGYVWNPNPAGNPTPEVNGETRSYSNNVESDIDWYGTTTTRNGLALRSCKRTVKTTKRNVRYGFKQWIYKKQELDLGTLAPGGNVTYLSGRGGTLPSPGTYDLIKILSVPGATDLPTSTFNWAGCIEERETVQAASFYPRPSGAYDHDIDGLPAAGDTNARKWKVALNDGPIYIRGTTNVSGGFDEGNIDSNNPTFKMADESTTNEYPRPESSCPPPATKMQTWAASTFKNYVNALTPLEDTFHDIGLLWGARLISPTGMYKKSNAKTPLEGNIERHIIFMTDGQTERGPNKVYGVYGHNWFDRRMTPGAASPSPRQVRDEIDKRTAGLCSAVRNKNITLWTVVFGDKDYPASGLNQTIIDQMKACATPGRDYVAKDKAALNATFSNIAAQIAQLRLTN